ncbi:MAG: glycosyltransferase [Lachnospiraceae bacterium]|nr:glycosyltransferase [Lachnospiraceae bacterium]
MPKVSILLAIFNGADAIRKSIGCLQKQTLKDIEIVCVDDNSTDNSLEIINELKSVDDRIKVVSFPENRGTICARKAGVMNATGEYLMFMDQDDEFEEFACEELYNMIKEKDVDIVNFRSRVIAVPPTTEEQRKWQEDFMSPYDGFLYGKDVFDYCFAPNFRDNQTWNYYTWNVWNKIYKTDVCKAAMQECREEYVVNGDDIYVYMLIAYYAKSYYGDAKGKFYHIYSLGSGLMGNHKLGLKRYYTLIRRATSVDNEIIFFKDKPEDFEEVVKLDRCRALCGIVQRWYSRLEPKEQANGYDMMCEYIEDDRLVASFEKHLKVNDANLISALIKSKRVQVTHSYIKNLCVYIADEASDKSVTMDLIKEWRSHGYKVICVTENGNDLSSLKLSDVPVYYMPKQEKEYKFYEYPIYERMKFIKNILEECHIDAYIYSGERNTRFVYDMIIVKNAGISFLIDTSEYAVLKKNMDSNEFKTYLRLINYTDGCILTKAETGNEYDLNGITTKYAIGGNYEELFDLTEENISSYSRKLDNIIEDAAFKKMCEKLAVKRMYKSGGLKVKIKIIIKKLLRIIGVKKSFYCDDYNDYIKLKQL